MRKVIFLLIMTITISSCKEDISSSRTFFPDIIVSQFKMVQDSSFRFKYQDLIYNDIFETLKSDQLYDYNKVTFEGYSYADYTALPDNDIKKQLTAFLYKNNGDFIEDVEVLFVDETMESIRIYSNKEYNGVKAGGSLNQFFSLRGRFVQVISANNYTLFEGDVLRRKAIQDLHLPLKFSVSITSKPMRTDNYKFYLEITTKKNTYTKEIVMINIK